MNPENTGRNQAGKFKSGVSGNPKGKPKGSRHKTTLAIQNLFDGEAEEIGRKAIELAKAGDITAIRLVMERILPPRKEVAINMELPEVNGVADILKVNSTIITAVASGQITLSEGRELTGILETLRKTIETNELEQRLTKLEKSYDKK